MLSAISSTPTKTIIYIKTIKILFAHGNRCCVCLTNYFCWGPTCYPPSSNETYTSANSLSINSGETLTGLDSFIGYVNNLPENSSLDIDYCFWVDGNPSDETCVVVTYTNKDSFMTTEDLSFSHEIYPNPVQDLLHINLLNSNPVELCQ